MITTQFIQFDHVVIFVADLNQAIEDFVQLGFHVTRGGSHGLTENALIVFSNHAYIELLALKPFWHNPITHLAHQLGLLHWLLAKKATITSRLLNWVSGELGPVDWVVRTDNLAQVEKAWRHAGLTVLKPETFSRKTITDDKVHWYLGGSNNPDLPILIEDITPYAQRVPAATASHPNQATALLTLRLQAQQGKIASHSLSQYLGAQLSPDHQGQQLIELGNVSLCFSEQPMPHNMQLDILCAHGQPQSLDISKSHGLQINLVPGA